MKKIIVWVVVALILIAGAFYFVKRTANTTPGKYDELAKCINNSGTIFYGAFWCPHCQNQKKLFGSSQKFLPYVECSTPDAKGQTQECIDKKIDGYPLWVYPDGSRESGEVSLEKLAEKTKCTLPS